jgi:hypothetical protein
MSATTARRLDNMDSIAYHYLGTPIILKDIIPELANDPTSHLELEVCRLAYDGPDEYTEQLLVNGVTSHPLMINQFASDMYRNRLIIEETMALYNRGHCVFVFLDRRELITSLLAEFKLLVNNDVIAPEIEEVNHIMGQGTAEERLRAQRDGRICLVTYMCGGTGLSFKRYTAAIFAHPRRNGFFQFNNRIFRIGGPETKREIVYIVDNKTSIKSQYSGFRSACIEERPKAVFTNRKVSWEEIEERVCKK